MNIHEDTSTEDKNNMEKKRKKMKFEAKVGIPLRSVEITMELKKKKNYMASIKIKKDRLPYRLK